MPSAPINVKVTNIDINFAIVHWDPPKTLNDTITHYNVHYREIDDIYRAARKVRGVEIQPSRSQEVYLKL